MNMGLPERRRGEVTRVAPSRSGTERAADIDTFYMAVGVTQYLGGLDV